MFYIFFLFILLIMHIQNYQIFVNEEFLVCIVLVIFFSFNFYMAKRTSLLIFYKEIYNIYLKNIYMYLLNIKSINQIKYLFLFLNEKIT